MRIKRKDSNKNDKNDKNDKLSLEEKFSSRKFSEQSQIFFQIRFKPKLKTEQNQAETQTETQAENQSWNKSSTKNPEQNQEEREKLRIFAWFRLRFFSNLAIKCKIKCKSKQKNLRAKENFILFRKKKRKKNEKKNEKKTKKNEKNEKKRKKRKKRNSTRILICFNYFYFYWCFLRKFYWILFFPEILFNFFFLFWAKILKFKTKRGIKKCFGITKKILSSKKLAVYIYQPVKISLAQSQITMKDYKLQAKGP